MIGGRFNNKANHHHVGTIFMSTQSFVIFSAILICGAISDLSRAQAQIPLPVYVAPTPVVRVHRPIFHPKAYYAATVPVTVNYPAYYAPQVPVVPMSYGAVPSMSAYYVPTAPLAQTYFAPVLPVKMSRRYAVSALPVVVQPVYWMPY
jgi:hypothetical protein